MLSEFGGIAMADPTLKHWGYSSTTSYDELAVKYRALLKVVRSLELLAGFCCTQFADTYQEANGLLRPIAPRKIPFEVIAEATGGPPPGGLPLVEFGLENLAPPYTAGAQPDEPEPITQEHPDVGEAGHELEGDGVSAVARPFRH